MYITPRVLIQQEFLQVPVYSEFPLPAFVIGPNFSLTRYSEASERPFTALGTLDGESLVSGNNYDPLSDVRYDFPNVPAGGAVDHSYTKVYAESVVAQYFPLTALGDPGMGGDSVDFIASPSGQPYTNKVWFPNTTLQTKNGSNRSDVFSNRDVAVNDIIEITDNLGNTVSARVKALEAETAALNGYLSSEIAPTLYTGSNGELDGSEFSASGQTFDETNVLGQYISIQGFGVRRIIAWSNATTLILDAAFPTNDDGLTYRIAGVYNDEGNAPYADEDSNNAVSYVASSGSNTNTTVTNASTDYVGYAAKRILSDTYRATVVSGSTLADVRFSVTSAQGAFTAKEVGLTITTEGTQGNEYTLGTLVVDDSNNNNIVFEFQKTVEGNALTFVLNSAWEVSVVAQVHQTKPNTSGTYTGSVDMVYKLAVERGGAFYDGTNASTCARLVITASDVDTSTVVLPRDNTSFNVGSFGVTAEFCYGSNNGGLILGDVYYIPVFAPKKGAIKIVEFAEDMPEAMLSLSSSRTAKLFLAQRSIEIPEVRNLLTDERNWTQEESYITVNAEATSYDNTLVAGNDPARLPIKSAKLFVEHRDLLQDAVTAIDSVRSLADVSSKLGTVHPDNPLAQGVYDAVLNAANQIVYFIGVNTNDLAGYVEAIKISEKSDKVYSFVPLTFNRTIQDAVVSHVNAYSTPEVGRWRVAWLSVEDKKSAVIYDTKEDETSYQATVTDDTSVSGTQNKLVTIVGAQFIDDVRPNDTVRINFRLNADGQLTYDEYVVDNVRTNTTLTLTKALAAPINVPTKVQVIRNYTKSERAYNISRVGGDYNNRRVRCVFPDTYKYGGVTKQGYFAAAGLAGLRSGVVPHQGLTNSEFLGADDLSKVVLEFTQDDLNTMAEQGIWLLTQEVVGATPYVRHQLTTDERSLNTSEDSITTNVDNISYALRKTLAPFIGRFNVNTENIALVRAAIVGELTYRATSTFTARAGNQLLSFTPQDDILRIERNSTYKDRMDVEVRLNVPYPLNYINLKLIVG
jgi:hypothetical protein